ncbi:MAG TPA: oligogalacturonate lyase family protein [Cyclobacteriaceae bacterium]|jgi:oligogalacturonide lyase|nr:oligogalacturonate lyase family protein [Cyclobacteriaceae bacterium]
MNKFIATFLSIGFLSCTHQKDPELKTGSQMPAVWIDADTGHKLTRLTTLENDNRSFYFHNDPFLPSKDGAGEIIIYYGSKKPRQSDKWHKANEIKQLYALNLKTLESKQLTHHASSISGEVVGKKRREVFYQSNDTIFATNVDSGIARVVFVFPDSIPHAGISSLNADETLLAGVFSVPEKDSILKHNPKKSDFFRLIYSAKLPHTIFTINIETKALTYIHTDTAWLNHVQFSPSNPSLLMFCHEGPWHLVNRIWTIDLHEKKPQLMHKRTVEGEIAGHESFGPAGDTVWFDLQIPRGKTFYFTGTDAKTLNEKRYAMTRDEWSIHFTTSPDGQLFSGDGGDSTQVAKAKNGKWIYLFKRQGDSLKSERLVNMEHHNYDLEPNVHFSPDGKWIIFRANFEGSSQVYAVAVEKE